MIFKWIRISRLPEKSFRWDPRSLMQIRDWFYPIEITTLVGLYFLIFFIIFAGKRIASLAIPVIWAHVRHILLVKFENISVLLYFLASTIIVGFWTIAQQNEREFYWNSTIYSINTLCHLLSYTFTFMNIFFQILNSFHLTAMNGKLGLNSWGVNILDQKVKLKVKPKSHRSQ